MKRRVLAGIVLGGILGYLYYKLVGCYSGTCAITSSPIVSTIYGSVLITLIIELLNEIRISIKKFIHKRNNTGNHIQ